MNQLYKILVNGQSCAAGSLKWSLPKAGKPGKWHRVNGELAMCASGLHLTTKPFMWYKWGCTCYAAEAKDIKEWNEDKCLCRSARLLEEVPHPRWWLDVIDFVASLKDMKWFDNHGEIDPKWKMFDARGAAWGATWGAAWGAAWDAARGAAWDATWGAARGAAWDAALKAMFILTSDLVIEESQRRFVDEMWHILTAGYEYLGTVNGVHYVFRKP
jgi:hypothetical protein